MVQQISLYFLQFLLLIIKCSSFLITLFLNKLQTSIDRKITVAANLRNDLNRIQKGLNDSYKKVQVKNRIMKFKLKCFSIV